jgi:hypothetical protein
MLFCPRKPPGKIKIESIHPLSEHTNMSSLPHTTDAAAIEAILRDISDIPAELRNLKTLATMTAGSLILASNGSLPASIIDHINQSHKGIVEAQANIYIRIGKAAEILAAISERGNADCLRADQMELPTFIQKPSISWSMPEHTHHGTGVVADFDGDSTVPAVFGPVLPLTTVPSASDAITSANMSTSMTVTAGGATATPGEPSPP